MGPVRTAKGPIQCDRCESIDPQKAMHPKGSDFRVDDHGSVLCIPCSTLGEFPRKAVKP